MVSVSIDFIIAVNNEKYFSECCKYINRIRIPEGYDINIIPIRGSSSMCSAYNQAMASSNADYRVYLHQDVFILNENFIQNFIEIFDSDDTIGMIGMMGASVLPKNGIALYTFDTGIVASQDPDMAYYLQDLSRVHTLSDVLAVDGVCIITRYDLPWREDLFQHFDFYDISQSLEMRCAGYRVVVPYMEKPWILHECGFAKMKSYMSDAAIAVKEYPEYFISDINATYEHSDELEALCHNFAALIKGMIDKGQWEMASTALGQYQQMGYRDTEIEILRNICTIRQYDSGCYIVNADNYVEILDRYIQFRFSLRWLEFKGESEMLSDMISALAVNEAVLYFSVIKNCFDYSKVFSLISGICIGQGKTEMAQVMINQSDKFKDRPIATAAAKASSKEKNQ